MLSRYMPSPQASKCLLHAHNETFVTLSVDVLIPACGWHGSRLLTNALWWLDATCACGREERLKREVANMERWSQEAEMRHEELSAKLPEATRPLLRQMEAMQAAAAAQAEAWAAAERHLTQRAGDAEAQAASAAERERLAVERLQVSDVH